MPRRATASQAEAGALAQATAAFNASLALQRCLACMAASLPTRDDYNPSAKQLTKTVTLPRCRRFLQDTVSHQLTISSHPAAASTGTVTDAAPA